MAVIIVGILVIVHEVIPRNQPPGELRQCLVQACIQDGEDHVGRSLAVYPGVRRGDFLEMPLKAEVRVVGDHAAPGAKTIGLCVFQEGVSGEDGERAHDVETSVQPHHLKR